MEPPAVLAVVMRFVVLRWFDSSIGPAAAVYTQQEADEHSLIVLETVGWLVAETDEPYGGWYTLAASKHGDEDWRGLQSIPKTNVIQAIYPKVEAEG